MAFVRGLMGPYMRPIPVGASAAMLFSLIVAFVVSPWAALRLLRKHAGGSDNSGHETEGWTTRLYRRIGGLQPLLDAVPRQYHRHRPAQPGREYIIQISGQVLFRFGIA